MRTQFASVEEYIATFPTNIQEKLQKIRKVIQEAVPNAQEVISYGMPAYKLGKVLVYFAAFANHISFFPTSSGVSAFTHELKDYAVSKGTIQFPLDKPIPYELIKQITKFRAQEVTAKA